MRQNSIFYLLLSAIATLPFAGWHFFAFGIPVYATELTVIFAVMLFCLYKWHQDTSEDKTIPHTIVFAVSAIVVGIILSALANGIVASELGIIKAWFFFPILFGWLLFQIVRTPRQLRQALLVWYATIIAVSITALGYFFRNDLTYDGRLRAFYLSPNYLALFVFPGIFLGWHFLKDSLDSRQSLSDPQADGNDTKKTFPLAAYLLSWLIVCMTLYLTLSYTIIVATALSFLIVRFLTSKKSAFSLAVSGIVLATFVGVFLATQIHTQKFSDLISLSERSSFASRIMIWQSSWKMIANHPIIGIGPGNFQSTYLDYQQYFPPYLEWAVPHPHNLYLAFWLQTGIIGLIGFLTLITIWIQMLYQAIFTEKENVRALVARTLFGIMIATLLIGLLDTPYWKNDLAYVFWLTIASGLALRSFHNQPEKKNIRGL